MNPLVTFATFFKAGGPFMYPIFVLAVVIVAIGAERWWLLMVKSRISSKRLVDRVVPRVGRDSTAAATCASGACESRPPC